MDITFPYKEAITNAYGLVDLILEQKIQRKKPKANHPYLMVKQVFQAVHFDKPFNQIVEETAEWK